ncbi:radical SAM protein [Sulfolobus sp. S-194]|nr:radical SAM protein [Sulfolobus sp. S-194]QIW23599.1 radical SAM protein [Sulfolobus sp. S-194]
MKYVNSIKNSDNKIISDMITNGYLLTLDRFKELLSLGVTSFQITFDGYKDFHDKLRIRLDGKGTFDKIMNNLIEIKNNIDEKFEIHIRVHINRLNLDSIKLLLNELSKTIANDERFIVYFAFLEKYGGPNDDKLPVVEKDYETRSKILYELYDYAKMLGLNVGKIAKNRIIKGMCSTATYPFGFIIKPDGKIAKCSQDLYSDRGIVGYLDNNGNLYLDKDKFGWWTRGLRSRNPAELLCPYENAINNEDIISLGMVIYEKYGKD